jgi:osmoprotectant transport system permease protein
VLLLAAFCAGARAEVLTVGSKRFTESYILGEIVAQTLPNAVHRAGLGGTGILFAALKAGEIDLYPEYTGTIARQILRDESAGSLAEINARLAPQGLGVAVPLGFSNSYALGMREDRAEALGIRTVSDLARHPDLRLGLGQEFMGRADGWPGLKTAYGLPHPTPSGLDHGLAYEALAAGTIDVMDVYTTDAKIERYSVRVLEDDKRFFPRYDAVLLYRLDVPQRFPKEFALLKKLEGRIGERQMIRLNAAAELEGRSFAQAAALFTGIEGSRVRQRTFLAVLFAPDFWRLTSQHLLLVFGSLAASIALGVPLGIVAGKLPRASQLVLGAVGVIQTIPSLALFAFLIAALGVIGTVPALIALFLYALLPIVRNTQAGLVQVGKGLVEAGTALGLSTRQVLVKVELPLALGSILAGIKTSAVINVGTATIAAFIGAGGYGERIVTGLALNDPTMLLAGAVPAAVLALVVQGLFELGERRFSWMARA